MQWLTLVPEDAGLQRLKSDRRTPATATAVDPAAPCPPVEAAGKDPRNPSRHASPARDRRAGERRQGDRRQRQVPVVLDTRSKHDRRALENRRNDGRDEAAATPAPRIDLYA